jgi:hypothetical protein
MTLLEQFLLWVHGMSGAAWFGALAYKTLIVDAKARAFFARPAEYEHFALHLAHNMRYFVIAGLLVCGLSGLALVPLRWNGTSSLWLGLMVAKGAAWIGACGMFAYVSWVHWPWRTFADPTEWPAYWRRAQRLALGMIALAGTGFALGQACRAVLWLRE